MQCPSPPEEYPAKQGLLEERAPASEQPFLRGYIDVHAKMLAEQAQLIANLTDICYSLGINLKSERAELAGDETPRPTEPTIREQLADLRQTQARQLDNLRLDVYSLRAQLIGS